ncbi:hypothetical protein NC652_019428 [Populus alba x Populus x berolinensis]|nr:hypothetical protein NC652_019428 [Populus alba x Populus x berolinensis]
MPPVVMILDSLVNFYALSSTNVLHLPEQVEGPFLRSSVDKESCGWKHTAAISEGNVFPWGLGGCHGPFLKMGVLLVDNWFVSSSDVNYEITFFQLVVVKCLKTSF